MKIYIKASRNEKPQEQKFTVDKYGTRFRVRTQIYEDPILFKFEVSEIHPYDLAEYAWAKKTGPLTATIFDESGRSLSDISLPDFDDEEYASESEYYEDILDTVYAELAEINKDVEPDIDRT